MDLVRKKVMYGKYIKWRNEKRERKGVSFNEYLRTKQK